MAVAAMSFASVGGSQLRNCCPQPMSSLRARQTPNLGLSNGLGRALPKNSGFLALPNRNRACAARRVTAASASLSPAAAFPAPLPQNAEQAKLIESISKGLNALRGVIRLARQCLKAVKLGTAAIAAAAQGPALLAGGGSGVMLSASLGLAGTLPLIGGAVASFIKMYLLLLFLRVLLTWFPNIEWDGQPWVTLRQITDPYLNVFRNMIPPVGGQIDFTPIIGFLVLQFLVQVLEDTVLEDDV
eukprot:jgi/Mesvir1/11874/Mv00220-RA.1